MVVAGSTAKQISKDGAKKLREQLMEYENERIELMDTLRAIKAQKSTGSLVEDVGYQKTYERLAYVQEQIENISHCLLRAEIMKEKHNTGRVEIGSNVKLSDEEKELELMIVDSVEADPLEGKISDCSPFGKALIGKSVNEEVEVSTMKLNKSHWKIVNIT